MTSALRLSISRVALASWGNKRADSAQAEQLREVALLP